MKNQNEKYQKEKYCLIFEVNWIINIIKFIESINFINLQIIF